MRSVCKHWNSLLSDSPFIKSHRHRSINKKDEILLFFGMNFKLELNSKPFTARPSSSPDLELTNFIKPPVIPERKYGYGFVIGSVNGLICFCMKSSHDFLVHIWNPSLSAIVSLPPSSLGSGRLHFGFGFDQKTDDYKFVKLTSFSRASDKIKQAEVYSMRKGSWEPISQRLLSHMTIIGGRNNQVCVNDHFHWLCAIDLKSRPQTIVGFDLGAEAFIEIPLPETILDHKVYKFPNVLGVLGGKLGVISRVIDGGKWEVWVMEEYGVAESWVKHHVFSQLSGDIIPYGFTSQGEFLFQVGINDDRFGLYDPVAAKTKHFKIMLRNSSIMKFVEYVDSLVWVPPPNHEISSCDISQLPIGK